MPTKRQLPVSTEPCKRTKEASPEGILDEAAQDALSNRIDPFLPRAELPLTEEQVLAALEIVRKNHRVTQFGLDGTGLHLGASSAHSLGRLPVCSLVFPFVLEFTSEGREAFIAAVSANQVLQSIQIGASNVDGTLDAAWRASGSAFVAEVGRNREEAMLPALCIDGFAISHAMEEPQDDGPHDESEGVGQEEESGDDSGAESEADCVQCDKKNCRREMRELDEVVFTSSMGLDYCSECVSIFPEERRSRLRRTTVAARLAEASCEPSVEDECAKGQLQGRSKQT